MNRQKKIFTPSITHYKILETIRALNARDDYPLAEGVYKVLKGINDEETSAYRDLETFSTLISYSSKKISRCIMVLLRHGYLEKIFDPKTDELYLKITGLGIGDLTNYKKKTHRTFAKKQILSRRTIVHLDRQK